MENKLNMFIVVIVIGVFISGLYGFIKTDQDYYRATTPHPANDSRFIKPYSYISEDGYKIDVEKKEFFTCAVYLNLSVCVLTKDIIDGKANISNLTTRLDYLKQKRYGR